MTVVDLHPEELLEKDALGQLDEAERARLDSHLSHCSICRFERQLRADFSEDLAADVPPIRFDGLVAHEAARVGEGEDEASPLSRRRSMWPRRRTRLTWLLAAAALLVGGAAAATGLNRPWHRTLEAPPVAPLSEPGTAKKAKPAPRQAPPPDVTGVTVNGSAAAEEAVRPASPPAIVPPAMMPPAMMVDRPDLRSLSVTAASLVPEPGPAELLDAESGARRRGDYGRVLELHRKLEARFVRSREAQVSRATVGRLMLDRGEPGPALASFDAYLRAGSGELGEEAMVGRATALERLGRADEASRAWGALLAAFPETPYAAHAMARVGGLNGN